MLGRWMLEEIAEHRTDDPASDGDQDDVIARLNIAVAVGRRAKVVRAVVVDHPIVAGVAAIEALTTAPMMATVVVNTALLNPNGLAVNVANLDRLAIHIVDLDHVAVGALGNRLLLHPLDVVAAIAVVIATARSGVGGYGDHGCGGGSGDDELLHDGLLESRLHRR